MYIFTITLTKAKISALTAVFLFIIMASIYVIPTFWDLRAVSTTEKYLIKNTERGRQDFINSLGWIVEKKPFLAEKMNIPTEFDKIYSDYNQLQKSQGLDLETYKGRKIEKYTYKVTNYPDKSLVVYINIFVLGNRVIAGDINSPNLENGFITNFLNI